MKREKISNKGITWEKITKPSKKDLIAALKTHKFKDLHIQACLPPIQRPRLETEESYLFMILTFPIYNKKTQEMEHVEIDFFVNHNFVITIQDKNYPPLDNLMKNLLTDKKLLNQVIRKNHGYLLFEILNQSFIETFPLLNDINREIESMEHRLFNGMDKGIIKEILATTHNIVDFKKTLTAHKSVLRRLVTKSTDYFNLAPLEDYFNELILYTIEIWDSIENYKDTIAARQSSHDSLYSWKLNEIIKTLTIFSVVIFSITFTAALFAVAPDGGMPFLESPTGFFKVIGVIIAVGLIVFAIFKKKKWL